MFKRIRHGCRATTLMEMMIATAVSTAFSGALITTSVLISKIATDISARNLCEISVQQSLDLLSRDLRSAIDVVDTYGSYQTTSDTLVLKLPALQEDYRPIDIDTRFDYVIYHPKPDDPNRFMRTIVADPDSRRGSDTHEVKFSVRAVSFEGFYAAEPDALGTHVLHVQLIAEKTARHKPVETPLSVSIKLRNPAV